MSFVKNFACQQLPAWSALKTYNKLCFHQGETVEVHVPCKKLAFCVLMGTCEVNDGGRITTVHQYEVYHAENNRVMVTGIFAPPFYFIRNVDIMVVGGEWDGADINLFMVNKSDAPENRSLWLGTPCDYYRNTNFDNHYHDFDEFWLVCEGSGVVQDNGSFYEVQAGDCIATPAGNHHDFPIVHNFVRALAIELTPKEGQRHGHLNETEHGKAPGSARE